MTTVYGVTGYGAKLQIAKQLKDFDDFPKDKVNAGSFYLAEKTFESLNDMFTSSQAIQNWFTQCATDISDDFRKYVEWITPLGLFVIQPYTKSVGKIEAVDYIVSKVHTVISDLTGFSLLKIKNKQFVRSFFVFCFYASI